MKKVCFSKRRMMRGFGFQEDQTCRSLHVPLRRDWKLSPTRRGFGGKAGMNFIQLEFSSVGEKNTIFLRAEGTQKSIMLSLTKRTAFLMTAGFAKSTSTICIHALLKCVSKLERSLRVSASQPTTRETLIARHWWTMWYPWQRPVNARNLRLQAASTGKRGKKCFFVTSLT